MYSFMQRASIYTNTNGKPNVAHNNLDSSSDCANTVLRFGDFSCLNRLQQNPHAHIFKLLKFYCIPMPYLTHQLLWIKNYILKLGGKRNKIKLTQNQLSFLTFGTWLFAIIVCCLRWVRYLYFGHGITFKFDLIVGFWTDHHRRIIWGNQMKVTSYYLT